MPNTKEPDVLITHLALTLEAKAIAKAIRKWKMAWWICFTCLAVALKKFINVMNFFIIVSKLDKMVKLDS